MLRVIFGCCLAVVSQAADLPGWWVSFQHLGRLESGFVQESESAVFGTLRRQGTIRLAQGGRLRVEYRQGLVLVADGRTLVQYDPAARTAQRTDLRAAALDSPMLNVLLNPAALAGFYRAEGGATGAVLLEPLRAGLPRVELTGQGGLPRLIRWTDPTGAKQSLEFQNPRVPGQAYDPSLFTFQAPAGIRWIN